MRKSREGVCAVAAAVAVLVLSACSAPLVTQTSIFALAFHF